MELASTFIPLVMHEDDIMLSGFCCNSSLTVNLIMEQIKNFFQTKPRLALALSALFLLSFQMGSYLLFDKDEPRYAAAAREMLEQGQYILPQFNYEPRYEKPILFYWLEMLSLKVLGVNEFAARFPSMLCATTLVLLVYNFLKRFGVGLLAGFILLTGVEFWMLARMSIIDMTLNLCMSASLMFFYQAINDKKRSNLYLCFIAAALGVLAKGPLALGVPGLIALVYLLVTTKLVDFFKTFWKEFILGFVVFFAIALPWYLSAHQQSAGVFTEVFFIEEHLHRFTGELKVHKSSPWWFYAPVIFVGFMPWSLYIFNTAACSIKKFQGRHEHCDLILFCLLWIAVFVGFYSAAGVKLINYILPVYTPLSILVSLSFCSDFHLLRYANSETQHQNLNILIILTGLWCILLLFVPNFVLKPYALKKQAAIANFAKSVPADKSIYAVSMLPQTAVFYSRRHIERLGAKKFKSKLIAGEEFYFIIRKNRLFKFEDVKNQILISDENDKMVFGSVNVSSN